MEPVSPRILIADNEPDSINPLIEVLRAEGILVELASGMEPLIEAVRNEQIDLVIADPGLHPDGGVELLHKLHAISPDLVVILAAGFSTLQDAVDAVKEGAFDYISKPLLEEETKLSIKRALEKSFLTKECRQLKEQLDGRFGFENFLVHDRNMQEVISIATAVAGSKATVLITGESGTGKTLLARAIHRESGRQDGPFVEINCGALPETLLESELFGHVKGAFTGAVRDKPGKFELAHGGTLFLDEIATATPALQVKLLRVIQDRVLERVGGDVTKTVDVRLVLASNVDLGAEVKKGNFREDLFYRINVITLEIPPLRKRPDDVMFLAHNFLQLYCDEYNRKIKGFSPDAAALMLSWLWPGNVRELENAVERAVVMCKSQFVQIKDLPPWLGEAAEAAREITAPTPDAISPPEVESVTPTPLPPNPDPTTIAPLKESLQKAEKLLISRALEVCRWNRSKTARILCIDRTTLFHKMRRYGIQQGQEVAPDPPPG